MENTEKQKKIFLFFSFISGIIELGTIFLGSDMGYSTNAIIGLALAYQIGNLVPNPLLLSYYCTIVLAIIQSGTLLLFYFQKSYWLLFFSIVLLGMIIQSGRSYSKSKVSTTKKRLFRIIGFLIAPVFNQYVLFFLAGLTVIITAMNSVKNTKCRIRIPKIKLISVIMIVHQIHYFCYSYFMILILKSLIKNSFSIILSFLFVLGWCTYISVPHLVHRKNYEIIFIIGHIFLASMLWGIFSSYPSKIVVLFWILTGFGGGTVYCIEKVNNSMKQIEKEDITFAENIGHVTGTLIGIIAYSVSNSVLTPVIVSCMAAIGAILLMTFNMLKNREII